MVQKRNDKEGEKQKKRRPLKTSAVVITIGDKELSYTEVLSWVRQTVKLSDEEMKALTTKRSATGGILLEIKGENNKLIASRLTDSLRNAFRKYENVKVHMPRQMAEMTLVGLDVSITKEEIKLAIANEGGCSTQDVTVGNIKTSPRGIGFVWARYPLAEATILERKKTIKIGWASVKVNLLPPRRLQCFRCLKTGHTKARCDEKVDRSDLCYNCGQKGHRSINCSAKTKCVICEEAGRAYNHRVGGPRCTAPPSRGRIGVFRKTPLKSPNRVGMEETSHRRLDTQVTERSEDMETEELEVNEERATLEEHNGS